MKRRLMACLMAVCMFTTVLAPVNSTFATETVEETAAPTAVPTEKPTEAPTAVPTEMPTEAPTETPVMTVTEEEPTEAPTEKPTEAPATEVPVTEAPATEVPATEAPATEVPVTEAPATEAPATEIPATEAPATEVPSAEPTVEPTPEESVEPSVSPSVEPSIPVPETELSVAAAANVAYAFANEDTISAKVAIGGGIAPYSMTLKVNGADVQTWTEIAEAGEYSVSHAPTGFGVHEFEITVTDALGVSKACGFEVPVAVREEEHESDWKKDFRNVELTGDWREDLIAIAKTQIGYEESERNFRIDDEGKKQGYTRYGEWYGSSYAEWCAMFVSFCLNYAEIPADGFPREANCDNWKELLQWKGAYEDDEREYEPKPGDLIFFNWQSDYDDTHKRENKPQHIGIVEKVTDSTVYTIEGNSYGAVRRQEYNRDSIVIVGYGNTEKLMDRAGVLAGEEIECAFVGAKAFTKGEGINLRSDATTSSDVVVKIEEANSEMIILGAKKTGEMVWYQVQYGEYTGYIRSDLIEIAENLIPSEPDATEEPAVTAEPSVEPTAEPEATVEPEETMGVPVDATIEPSAEPTPAPTEEPTVIIGVTVTDNVNIRQQPTTDSERVTYIPAAGEEVQIAGSGEVNGELWYAVIYGEYKGYIRADLIAILEQPTAEPTVEPTAEPETVCECADSEGNRVCAEDCTCECHAEDLPVVEDELLCVCTDAEGNRICAEDCACECHVVEEPAVECVCFDEAGNRVCAEDCTCECHVVEAPVCVCYGAEGNMICAEGCVCECHVPVIEEPAEIEYKPWEQGVVETVMSYAVEGAVHYSWQRGMANEDGEMVWEELATTNHTEVLLTTMFSDLAYSYRCVATMEDGTQTISDEITLIDAELVKWMNETEVTEEMLARAMNAKSLDSIVIEDDAVFYVRTGEVYARIDKVTGYMIDEKTGLVIAVFDMENGLIYPLTMNSGEEE